MTPALSRAQVREVDRRAIEEYGLPGLVLMENAGAGAALWLEQLGIRGRVAICCGKGNNAGDGFVIARHLENRGHRVDVLLCVGPEELTGDAAVNLHVLQRAGTPLRVLTGDRGRPQDWTAALVGSDWIVDALLGTGLQGPVRPPFSTVIDAINGCGLKTFAVDLPSGLDCDTGLPLGTAVRARYTATFVAQKRGFDVPEAAEYVGRVEVIDIGAPRKLVREIASQGS